MSQKHFLLSVTGSLDTEKNEGSELWIGRERRTARACGKEGWDRRQSLMWKRVWRKDQKQTLIQWRSKRWLNLDTFSWKQQQDLLMKWICSRRGFISSREQNLKIYSFIFSISHIHEIMLTLKSKIYIIAKNWMVEFFLFQRNPKSLLMNSLIKCEVLNFQTSVGVFV